MITIYSQHCKGWLGRANIIRFVGENTKVWLTFGEESPNFTMSTSRKSRSTNFWEALVGVLNDHFWESSLFQTRVWAHDVVPR